MRRKEGVRRRPALRLLPAIVVAAVVSLAVGIGLAVAEDDPQPIDFTHNSFDADAPVTGGVFGSGPAFKTGVAICTTPTQLAPNVNTDCDATASNGITNPHNETSIAVGLTAIDVSLCGFVIPFDAVASQSVFTFGASCVGVVQIATPVLNAGPLPKTPPVTGASASKLLCVKSIGCGSSSATARPMPTASETTAATTIAGNSRRAGLRRTPSFLRMSAPPQISVAALGPPARHAVTIIEVSLPASNSVGGNYRVGLGRSAIVVGGSCPTWKLRHRP